MSAVRTVLVLAALIAARANADEVRVTAPTSKVAAGLTVSAAQTSKTRGRREARIIPLDEKQARTFHTLYTHPSIPAILEFPEPFVGTPSCGDCVDGSAAQEALASSDALFVVDLFPTEQYISIKPAQYSKRDGGRVPDEHFITTLTVRLASKLTITVKVQYGTVENADARVIFTLPNRAAESQFVQDQIAKARSELESSFTDKLKVGVRQAFMQALAEPHECVRATDRARRDDIVVELREICRFGSTVYIRFEVENRGRPTLSLGDVQVSYKAGGQVVPIEGIDRYLPQAELEFQHRSVGVVGFALDAEERASRQYEFSLHERGGRNREVVISEVRF